MKRKGTTLCTAVAVLILSFGAGAAYAQGTLFVEGDNVGIGVSTPTQKLHVMSSSGAAQIYVQETSSGEHVLFRLSNPGKTRFLVDNTTAGAWTFDVDNAARFNISRTGTGVNEFLVESDGDGFFRGDVYARGVKLTSSRQTKDVIEPLNEQELLARLMEVPVSRWQFKQDESGARHIGPMAEDFQEVFELGDGQHLSMTDVQGVALAAIQGLNSKLEQENAQLRAELQELRAAVNLLLANQE